MLAPVRARRLLAAALGALTLVVGGLVAATPSVAADRLDPALVQPYPGPRGAVRPQATIENEATFCQFLSGYYLGHPSWYSARVYNCRSTDIFIQAVYFGGGYGTCVLVPAKHSRHLGGSLIKPIEDIRIC